MNKLLLIRESSKIFVPYSLENNEVLIHYNGIDKFDDISKWIDESYNIQVINFRILDTGRIIVATIGECEEVYSGKLISFASAIKKLNESETHNIVRKYLNEQISVMNVKLHYGIRNNKVVSIDEITENEKGLKCNCTCPGCGMVLQARIGNGKRQRHFSHNNSSCNTVSAQQTALHMLAKELIETEKKIMLPPLVVSKEEVFKDNYDDGYYWDLPKYLIYKKSRQIICDSVVLEKRVSSIIPDIIVNVGGKECLIEIAVTHFVDEDKAKKIQEVGLPLIEINLSDLRGDILNREKIKTIISDKEDNKSWIYNPIKDQAIIWAKEQYNMLFEKMKKEDEEKEQRYLEQARKIKEKREKTEAIINDLFKPKNYKQAILKLRNDEHFYKIYPQFLFSKEAKVPPFFIDIPITGEMVFACDRRIWQCAIFDKFVYNRKIDENSKSTIHIQKIESWITKHQNLFKVNWNLVPKTFIMIKNLGKNRSLLYETVKQYLEYLSMLGFISDVYYQEANVLKGHSIIPPSKAIDIEFQKILQKVNIYSPDINEKIDVLFHPNHFYQWSTIDNSLNESVDEDGDEFENGQIKQAYELKQKQLVDNRINRYEAGLEEVINKGAFAKKDIVKDSFEYRWLICTECGQIKREDEMTSYGGYENINTGVCRDCSR